MAEEKGAKDEKTENVEKPEKIGKAGKVEKVEIVEKKIKKPAKPEKDREKERMRVIVRFLGTDLNGEKSISGAILKIKGISYSFANALCKSAKIDPNRKLGSFTESELLELEKLIKNPSSIGIPLWVLNRRKDIESGVDMHVTGSDVDVSRKFDIQRMVDKKSYKGVRHMLGLPVRGQRTRSSFRQGRTVGVVRKSVRLAAGAATGGPPKTAVPVVPKKEGKEAKEGK